MYAYQMDVDQPMDMYDRVRAEVVKTIGKEMPDGCLLHMVTDTATGFRVTEVWDSHEACDRFGDEIMRPTVERVGGPAAVQAGPPPNQELAVHMLQIAHAAQAAV